MKTKLPSGVLSHKYECQPSDKSKYKKGNPNEASDVTLGAGNDVKLLSLRLGLENPWYRCDTEGAQLERLDQGPPSRVLNWVVREPIRNA